ncbi:MAG TPA: TIGR03435 family protein [Bryobacteraceae bacterium]|nr:TIGR03435 family protein [Bryobacteraceae bacterium]
MRSVFRLAAGVFCVAAVWAQPAFEAASVRYLPPPAGSRISTGGGPGTSDPERWVRSNVTLGSLLVQAFGVQGRLLEMPDWATAERYEVIAKVPAGASKADIAPMLRALLTERFHMAWHRDHRTMRVYEMRRVSGAPALSPAESAADSFSVNDSGSNRVIVAKGISLADLAGYFSGQMDRPLIDQTGLSRVFDVELRYPKAEAEAESGGYALRMAARDQLGIEFRSGASAVNVIVVDSIDRSPTPN